MFAKRQKAQSQEAKETNILLALVILSVVIPTVGFLWFMTRAMNNERAAMREQSKELHEMHLSAGKRQVERALKRMASSSLTALTQADLTEAQRFHRLCRRGLADSVICLSSDGQPTFPIQPDAIDEISLAEADEKAEALIAAWDPADGYPSLLQVFERDECKDGRDWHGRYIYPNLQLTALESLPSDSAVFTRIADELSRSLALRELPWPTAQRLSLAAGLRQMGRQVEVPSEAGFQLALDVLEHSIQLGQSGVLQPSPALSDTWRLLTDDRRFLLIFSTATIRQTLEAAAQKSSGELASAIAVVPDSAQQSESMPVGAIAPQWHLAISDDALADQSDPAQKRAFVLAMSCMLVALTGVIATFAIRRFLAQSRLTQLRNDFLSTISHELKTPLASTRMLVDTLVGGNVKDPEKTRNYLEVIGRENTRLSHLVENFLTYSRLESGRMPFDFQGVMPEDIANQALDALEGKLSSDDVDLQVFLAEDLPYVRADEATLCIALINLLDNAYKYTGAEKRIRFDVRQEGLNVHFSVQDNGIGLSASQRESVKERFYRVNESDAHGGSGLGLSIVSDIASAHQGELVIESLPGEGSIFTLIIPVSGNR